MIQSDFGQCRIAPPCKKMSRTRSNPPPPSHDGWSNGRSRSRTYVEHDMMYHWIGVVISSQQRVMMLMMMLMLMMVGLSFYYNVNEMLSTAPVECDIAAWLIDFNGIDIVIVMFRKAS
jgi:hypothetical protein